MDEAMSANAQSWRVNVGGEVFEASRQTFNQSVVLATFLGEDLSNDTSEPASPPFWDRDPELFREVLRLLRGHRFLQHPRLKWHEVRAEADFYQVSNLDELGPPPVLVFPPDLPAFPRKLSLERTNTRKAYWIPRSLSGSSLPPDVLSELSQIQQDRVISEGALPRLGFLRIGDTNEYIRKEKIAFYAKDWKIPLEVTSFPSEIERVETEKWLSVTFWIPQNEGCQI